MTVLCQQLENYLDGSLDVNHVSEFEQHLETCSDCQKVVEADQAVSERLFDAWTSVPSPKSLQSAVSARNEVSSRNETEKNRVTSHRWFVPILATAGTVLILVSFVFLWNSETRFGNSHSQSKPDESSANQLEIEPLVTFESDDSKSILLPIETESSKFTIVRAFPTINPKPSPDSGIQNHEFEKLH